MNLVLDFGNTRVKAGVFKGNELIDQMTFDSAAALIRSLDKFHAIEHCLIASVTKDHQEAFGKLSAKFDTRLFSLNTKIPIKNLYKSALTLGSDRLAAAIGSWHFYPGKNVLTIDAGTCIKYNFVNSDNEYLGGAISPGIPMRLKAMHEYTSALPLVDYDKNYNILTGRSTTESLLSGALIGAASEVDGIIDRYKAEHNGLVVVMTGGDADYLGKQLKNTFFANQNILIQGLNTILNFNLEK